MKSTLHKTCMAAMVFAVLLSLPVTALADVNGDTKLDAVFANNPQTNRVCLGDGALDVQLDEVATIRASEPMSSGTGDSAIALDAVGVGSG